MSEELKNTVGIENEENNESTENKDVQQGGTASDKQEELKTFTQAELDEIIKREKAKAKREMPSKDEITAFKAWKEAQKTEAEKQAELQREAIEAKAELQRLKNEKAVISKNVNPKFAEYITFTVMKQMGENGDFESELEAFLKDNEQFIAKDNQTRTTGFSQAGGSAQTDDKKAYLDKKYKNNPYYKG